MGLRSRLRSHLQSHLLTRRKVLRSPYQGIFFETRCFFCRRLRILEALSSPGYDDEKQRVVGWVKRR